MTRPVSPVPSVSELDPSGPEGTNGANGRQHSILPLRRAAGRSPTSAADTMSSRNPNPGAGHDPELMERVRRGDAGAFEVVVESYWQGTLGYVRHLCGDPERAYEVTQEAFSRLWQKREEWTGSGSVRVWLLRTARNTVISDRRKWKVRALGALKLAVEERSVRTPLEDVEALELRAAIQRALWKLPARRREAFVLFHLQGFSYREISGIMGVRPQTVANYLQAALADLRVLLSSHMPQHFAGEAMPGPEKDEPHE